MHRTAFAFNLRTLAAAALVLMLAIMASAQSERVIYSFTGGSDGGLPYGGVISDANGNLYGTTFQGGANYAGTVFELTPNSGGVWTETVLYSFSFSSTDGALPTSGLVFDAKGNLYGLTLSGGPSARGTIFELSPGANGLWTEKILYSFAGGSDGSAPFTASLALDSSGNLYGITQDGGIYGFGTVFELVAGSNATWTKNILHSFSGGNDGANPYGEALTLDAAGNVYGTTPIAGLHDYGVIFELVRGANGNWTEKVLHAFTGASDGSASLGGLVFDASGNLYGNSLYSVFELTPGSNGIWTEKVLHRFEGGRDGAYPGSALTFDGRGRLYGTTSAGGAHRGTVFKLTPGENGTWTEGILHRFASTGGDGAFPGFAGLVVGVNGHLYGTTSQGGASNNGAVFEVIP